MRTKKKSVSDQNFKITKIQKRNSQVNQGSINWRIDFESPWYTQIDSSMKNFSNWKEIMDLGPGTVLTNLSIKNQTTGIIDADSKPKIVSQGGNTFHDLFQ
jgi:hypothetical protein